MSNLAEKFEGNAVPTEIEEKRWELFGNKEPRLRDEKHLEMAYEWLMRRGKIVSLEDEIESA